MKGAVASGHPLTARAAADMFSLGGNAFDAAVSAGFASVAAEPTLTSFGGGGFLLAHIEKQNRDVLFDFFVNTPGLGWKEKPKTGMVPVNIDFSGCTQTFHIGCSSAAVPGLLKGLLHSHERLCTLPLKTIIAPALSCLKDGLKISVLQEYFLNLLKPIFTSSDYGKEICTRNGRFIKSGDRLFNPMLENFFRGIADNTSDIYTGEIARKFIAEMKIQGGLISQDDLDAYEVIEREPLHIKYRDREILTNPPPSSGGVKLALALHLLENLEISSLDHASETFLIPLVELMMELHSFKPISNGNSISYPFPDSEISPILQQYIKSISDKSFISTQGTTHISVIDEEGNAVSMTTSNGSGSGYFIPGTGIMINNMMGEDDLHPDGFFSSPRGQRVSSMMIPTMVLKGGKVESVMGSGGSKRIKTAVLQVLLNLIDFSYSLEDAVEASRVHFEDGIVQIEPDVPEEVVEKLGKHYKTNRWKKKNMYFGGVHCVNGRMQGWGDSRRGGCFLVSD
ncbi:MAG: gamma-glutamyltransferase [Nitrospirota bacterium]